jgi:hypothetical protein
VQHLKQQMINLKEERDSLKAQLQHERGIIVCVFSRTKGSLGQVSVLSCTLSGVTGNLTQVSALFCCPVVHVGQTVFSLK